VAQYGTMDHASSKDHFRGNALFQRSDRAIWFIAPTIDRCSHSIAMSMRFDRSSKISHCCFRYGKGPCRPARWRSDRVRSRSPVGRSGTVFKSPVLKLRMTRKPIKVEITQEGEKRSLLKIYEDGRESVHLSKRSRRRGIRHPSHTGIGNSEQGDEGFSKR
jgi:hypothetical protein